MGSTATPVEINVNLKHRGTVDEALKDIGFPDSNRSVGPPTGVLGWIHHGNFPLRRPEFSEEPGEQPESSGSSWTFQSGVTSTVLMEEEGFLCSSGELKIKSRNSGFGGDKSMKKSMMMLIELLAKAGLDQLPRALSFGAALLVALVLATGAFSFTHGWFSFLFRWLHVISGVMWIGLLWYFNFVQIPSMPKIPDDQKPAIGKVIAPTALFWFRWAALSTLLTGLLVGSMQGYLAHALSLGFYGEGPARDLYIGVGMWLGLLMAFNVWNIIWPNQKIALGIIEASADEKKAAARIAMLTSRLNTLFSIPMLYFMVAAQNVA